MIVLQFRLKRTITVLLILSSTRVLSQHLSDSTSTKYHKSLILAVGRSYFHVTNIQTESFPCWNLRAGARLSKQITSFAAWSVGFNVVVKFGRDSYYRGGYTGTRVPIPLLDDTATRSHLAFELPVEMILKLFKGSRIRLGVMGKSWYTNDYSGDVLRSQREVGAIAGISRDISTKFALSINGYLGLTALPTGVIGFSSNPAIKYRLTNRFVDFGVEYKLGRRRTSL